LNFQEEQGHNNLGVLFLRENNYEKARDEFQREVSFYPNRTLGWSNLGLAYSRLGDFAASEAAYLHAIAIDPDDATAYSRLATLYATTDHHDALIRLLSELDRLGLLTERKPVH
jgi:Flp pilus assembly protein TadD